MLQIVNYFERLLAWTFRQHFRIPYLTFWTALLGGVVLAFFLPAPEIWAAVAVAIVGLVGVVRWRSYRRRPNFLVIPRPVSVDPDDPLAIRAQQLIIESLTSRLTPDEMTLVTPIPARLGPTDVSLADDIRRRLHAGMVLVGRIDPRPGGGWSLFAGLLSAPDIDVIHLDFHTRDRLPARAQWDLVVDRFTPTRDVQDVEDPLFLSGELEAVVRGFAGRVAALMQDHERAAKELRAAIDAAADSATWPIDALRVALAESLAALGRRSEGLEILRQRANGSDPSPELLRRFAFLLGPQPGDFTEHLEKPTSIAARRDEALAALRKAAKVRTDPKRAMTLYNLASLPGGSTNESEAEDALREAMRQSRFYRRAWYARRAVGASYWYRAVQAEADGNVEEARALFAQAAKWYDAALRSRPRFRVWWRSGAVRIPFARFRQSPILRANAEDAHEKAGHTVRARWLDWRVERARKRLVKRGNKMYLRREWLKAYANFDFAVIGRRDFMEAYARVLRTVCLQQEGHYAEAAADFAETDSRFPDVALLIRGGCASPEAPPLPAGVPGDWPAEPDAVIAILRERGFATPEGVSESAAESDLPQD